MAGHSHWANIKHKKGVNDRAKAAVIARMGVLIAVAVQLGGPKPEDNPRLRLAIAKARSANMNMEAIERAIKKTAGLAGPGKMLSDVSYEGYGPGSVAMVVVVLTDNRHRTAPEIKKLFERAGGAIGAPGCVAWQFKDRSVFLVDTANDEAVMSALIAGGADAEDIIGLGSQVEVVAAPGQFDVITRALTEAGLTIAQSDLTKIPENTIALEDPEALAGLQNLVETLEEHPDVQEVFTNLRLPAEAAGTGLASR